MDDILDMTDEQFAEMGRQHAVLQSEALATAERERDERGRFVAKTEEAPLVEATESEEVDEVVYRRVIDLGDGSGTQVFEGSSPEDLIEKFVTAQEHATRKIRELSAAKRVVETPAVKEASADEEWLMSQELLATPSKAFDKMFEQRVGMPITSFKTQMERIQAFERAQTEHTNAVSFVESTPEYFANEFNSSLMQNYLKTFKLEGSPENIKKAFTDLSQGGLLQLKTDDSETETPGDTTVTPSKQRIAAPAGVRTVVIQKKAASGLSAKRSGASQGPPSEKDLYEMSDAEFFKLGGMSVQDNW